MLLSSALALGFLHGLGPDHLMAITALSVGAPTLSRGRDALVLALRFACGHVVLLAVAALGGAWLGATVPRVAEEAGELLAGILLVALGLACALALLTRRVYGHTHPHGPDGRSHWHMHVGGAHRHATRGHAHLPSLLGAAFAISGVRALTIVGAQGIKPGSLPLLGPILLALLFACGLILSMTLFGLLLGGVLSTRAASRMGQGASWLTAAASTLLGVYWMLASRF
jgi:hypothetical protein